MNLAVIITAATSLVAAEQGIYIEQAARELSQLPARVWQVNKRILPVERFMSPIDQAYEALDFGIIQAASANEANDYQKLEAIFKAAQGKVPSNADLKSWRSGRLYRPEDPGKAVGTVMIGAMVTDKGERLVLIPYFHEGPASEVDHPTEELARRIAEQSRAKIGQASSPKLERGSLTFSLARQGERKNFSDFFDLRIAGELWVMRWERINPINRQVFYLYFDRKTSVKPQN